MRPRRPRLNCAGARCNVPDLRVGPSRFSHTGSNTAPVFPRLVFDMGRRFRDTFFGLLLDRACSQRSQLFLVAAEHSLLKPKLAISFPSGQNYGRPLFMNIDFPPSFRPNTLAPDQAGEQLRLLHRKVDLAAADGLPSQP